MAVEIYVSLTDAEIGRVERGADFEIRQDDQLLGRINVARGGLRYYPNGFTYPFKISWADFDRLMRDQEQER